MRSDFGPSAIRQGVKERRAVCDGRAHRNVRDLRLSATATWTPNATQQVGAAFQVKLEVSTAAALLQAVPPSCDSLSISEFVTQQAVAAGRTPLDLPRLITLRLECRRGYVDRVLDLVRSDGSALTALTRLEVCSRPYPESSLACVSVFFRTYLG